MSEPKFTLKEFERAVNKTKKEGLGSLAIISMEEVSAELTTPEPEFADGQVVATNYGDGGIPRYNQIIGIENNKNKDVNLSDDRYGGFYEHSRDLRPLDQQEVGPGWVPRAEFEKLRDQLDYIRELPDIYSVAAITAGVQRALDAIPENLK